MGWGKMVELFDSRITLVYEKNMKGQDRTIASLIVCVLLLTYYLEIENSNAASQIMQRNVFLPILSFAALHLFGFLIFHQQLLSAFFQYEGVLLKTLFDFILTIGIAYVNYYIMFKPQEYVNWRLVLFTLSYATFHFLLVIYEIGGEDFRLMRSCLGSAFLLTMFIQQWKTFGAIVFVVSTALFFFKECHIKMTLQQRAKVLEVEILALKATLSSSSSL